MLETPRSRRIATVLGLAFFPGLGCTTSVTTTAVPIAPVPAAAASSGPTGSELVASSRDLVYRVEPVAEAEPKGDGPSALDVWRKLLAGIESDPETADTLKKMFAGWPVQLERLDGPAATDAKLHDNPDDDHKFIVRLASLGAENEGAGPNPRLVVTIACGVASQHAVPDPNAPLYRGAVTYDQYGVEIPPPPAHPTPDETLGPLLEDHLLRHLPEWRLVAVDSEEKPADPDQRQARLDEAIQRHAEAVRTRFGTPDQPLPAPKPNPDSLPAPDDGSDTP